METAMAPKRLHYAWVVMLAFVLMFTGLYVSMLFNTASSQAAEFARFMAVFIGAFLSMPLLVWLLVIWSICGGKHPWRGRTWLALLPSALLLAAGLVYVVQLPPREQRLRYHFRELLNAEIPADAREMDVTSPARDDVEFTFRCSKESTQALIKSMRLEPQDVEPPFSSRLARDWSKNHWADAQYYKQTDERGVEHLLIADSRLERVWVARAVQFAESKDVLKRGASD
jgi:hypothetical protein